MSKVVIILIAIFAIYNQSLTQTTEPSEVESTDEQCLIEPDDPGKIL